jgi:hypothetical protein
MSVEGKVIDAVRARIAPLTMWKERWGRTTIWLAIALFVCGTAYSLITLDVNWTRSGLFAMAVLTLGMGVVMLVYSALSLVLMAQACGKRISFGAALRVSSNAQMAEALPLPGGAIVRTVALVEVGASIKNSVVLVVSTALLWIALASVATGAILLGQLPTVGALLLAGGSTLAIPALFLIGRKGGLLNASLTLLLRIAGIGIAALRLSLAFAVIDIALPLPNAMPYALAAIAGSASSLVPGGLGVSEALGALMASAIDASPQSAFLALAINRIAQFVGTAMFAPVIEFLMTPAKLGVRQ